MLPEKYVITIGRTFGSGGRALGKAIADKLGISFYDKMLLVKAAEKAGYNLEFFEKNDERAPSVMGSAMPFSFGFYPMSWIGNTGGCGSDSTYSAQCDLMHELAASEPCVIVGRSADYVLRDLPNVVNIFVHAPIEECVRRITSRGDVIRPADAKALAERTNKLRANFYNFYTDKRWGHAESYDLCVNSYGCDIDTLADFVINFIKQRLDK